MSVHSSLFVVISEANIVTMHLCLQALHIMTGQNTVKVIPGLGRKISLTIAEIILADMIDNGDIINPGG